MIKLTYEVVAKMFRCPDCLADPPVEVRDVPGVTRPTQCIKTLHDPSCVHATHCVIDPDTGDKHLFIDFSTAYMPYEVDDDDRVLRRLGKSDIGM